MSAWHDTTGRRALLVLAFALAACGGGDDDSADDLRLEEVEPGSTEEQAATSTTADAADDLDACLGRAGLSLAEPGDPDLPITAFEGGGPPTVQDVEGIGIRADTGAAVAFVYDTPGDAETAASMLGVAASGTVVVAADAAFPPSGQAALVECLGGEAAPSGGGDSGGSAAGVSPESAACVTGRGFELTGPGATDLPIADADGEGLPVIDGVAGIGIRGATGAAVFYPYATEAEANDTFVNFGSDPDVVLVQARVDAIAVDNVFIASDPGFPSDERFFLADCFD